MRIFSILLYGTTWVSLIGITTYTAYAFYKFGKD